MLLIYKSDHRKGGTSCMGHLQRDVGADGLHTPGSVPGRMVQGHQVSPTGNSEVQRRPGMLVE